MGTKNNPSKFDCWSRAEPDEPVFVLLGRDPVAALTIHYWAWLREAIGRAEPDVLAESRDCADQMRRWAESLGKEDELQTAAHVHETSLIFGVKRHQLAALCLRAADVIRHCVMINDSDGGMRDRDELLQIEKQLRGA